MSPMLYVAIENLKKTGARSSKTPSRSPEKGAVLPLPLPNIKCSFGAPRRSAHLRFYAIKLRTNGPFFLFELIILRDNICYNSFHVSY